MYKSSTSLKRIYSYEAIVKVLKFSTLSSESLKYLNAFEQTLELALNFGCISPRFDASYKSYHMIFWQTGTHRVSGNTACLAATLS